MPVEVILPKVDMDMATGKISRWYVEEGAVVKKGDVLFEIETDKATMEIDAPASGTLRQITGKEGVDIPVGSPVAWLYEEGEALQDAPAASADTVASAAPVPQGAEAAAQSQPALQTQAAAASGGVRATPLARRLGREKGIDLSKVNGSGPQGRILRADIDAFSASTSVAAPVAPAPVAAEAQVSGGDDAVTRLFAEGTYDLVPHDNMRRTIARRLTESKSTVPHFYLSVESEIDDLLALRAKLNGAAASGGSQPAYKISVNDMVIKAMAMALRDVPDANVSWSENAMIRHRQVDVGVAVSIPGGLITPVVRQADRKSISAISNEMKDLAVRARERKLKTEEYQGGTTAISNLGMFGVREFAAIINPPHASILAVGAGERRVVVREDDSVVPATVMNLTLSSDHRAVDGALGAQLLAAVKRYIENPYLMLA